MRTILLGAVAALALSTGALAQNNQGGGGQGGAQTQPPIMNMPSGPAGNQQKMQQGGTAPRAASPDATRRDDAAQRQPMDQGAGQGEQRRMKSDQAAGQGANDRPTASGNVGSRTRINITAPSQKTVIKNNIVRTNVKIPAGVTIAVGSVLPATIAFQPVPAAIIAEIPDLEPYYYVVVDGQIVFVDPATYAIVYVMPLA